MRLTDCRHDRSLCFARMAQFEVRLSRKLYKRGDRTEARISLRIQTDSACTCSLPEMTMKLVNRITLVTAHIVRATNMRMIICFMILLLSSCDLPKARTTPLIASHQSRLSTKQDSFTSYFIPGVRISVCWWQDCLKPRLGWR